LLCRRHHRLLHEGGFSVAVAEAGELVFRRPDGGVLERCPAPGRSRPGALGARRKRRLGAAIGPDTSATRFPGERLDYDIAVEGLVARAGPQGPRAP